MIAYLDTHAAVWLAQGDYSNFSATARQIINRDELLLAPMALLEIEYLHEIKQTRLSAADILRNLNRDYSVEVCTLPGSLVAMTALSERWTRDPFDRMIVAQARTNGLAMLLTSDRKIARHYVRTLI